MSDFLLTYDFVQESLKANYPNRTYTNSYNDIKRFLTSNGFTWRQKSVFIGNFQKANKLA